MKTLISFAVLFTFCNPAPVAAKDGISWVEDYSAGLKQAKSEKKKVFLYFGFET